MNTRKAVLTLGGICASVILVGAGATVIKANFNMKADVPVAGISVTLNEFFEGNDNADSDIIKYLGLEEVETEEETEALTEAETEALTEAETVAVTKAYVSPYANIAVSQVGTEDGYVNIRDKASTDGEIVGKIYNNCAATILETVAGEGGTWYHISSGSVTGYIKSDYFVTGDEAEKIAIKIGKLLGRVKVGGLRLRTEPNTNSDVITKLYEDEVYSVLGQEGDFVKIILGRDDNEEAAGGTAIEGYVAAEYIDVDVKFDKAISLEEEAAKIAEEQERIRQAKEAEDRLKAAQAEAEAQAKAARDAEERAAAEAAAAKANEAAIAQANAAKAAEAARVAEAAKAAQAAEAARAAEAAAAAAKAEQERAAAAAAAAAAKAAAPAPAAVSTATRDAVVSYAKQFVGNPYVYGGTSLTNGCDCSGLTMSVYKKFGINLPHSSSGQSRCGRAISVGELRPGDLIFYGHGSSISHVVLYIGNGKVINASDENTGIVIKPYDYRPVLKCVNVIGD